MSSLKVIRYIPILLLLLCSFISADDLGKISLESKSETITAENIFSTAISRLGNNYFVTISPTQKILLERAEIDYEIVLENIDIDQSYMFFPSRNERAVNQKTYDIYNLVDVGGGVKIGNVGRLSANNINELTDRMAISLSDHSIPFKYLPKVLSTGISGLTSIPTDTLADLVSNDSVYAWDTRLEAFHSRYIYTDSIHAARDWMVDQFTGWGYTDVSWQSFYYNGLLCHNVYVVKQGYAEPDKVIVVGGHYDSITYNQPTSASEYAPGADDNGSGTSAVLELARVLADVPTRKTIIFIPFSAEEVGLVGAWKASNEFINASTDVEVMLNFDMIGYTETNLTNVGVMGNPSNINYAFTVLYAMMRVTGLTPYIDALSGSSDHWPFHQNGFNFVYTDESTFNFAGWHTDIDNASRLNFDYMSDIIRGNAAAIGQIANSPAGTEIENIIDVGDGLSLEVFIKDCIPGSFYRLFYSTDPNTYVDFVTLPSGVCSYEFNSLTEGVTYYFKAIEINDEGYEAIYSIEASEVPLVIPRAPVDFVGEPRPGMIRMSWRGSIEGDFSHYRMYRDEGSGFVLHQDNLDDTVSYDSDVVGGMYYDYKITAVDFDMNESDFSAIITATSATFDQGILLADETIQGIPMPSEANQEIHFNNIFGEVPIVIEKVDGSNPINKNDMAPYSSIFWIDNDFSDKLFKDNLDSLNWYLGYNTNVFYSTFMTLAFLYGSPINHGHPLYTEFGFDAFKENSNSDFYGAKGQNGWPDIKTDPSSPFGSTMTSVTVMTPHPSATVIYTYDSFTDDPEYEDEPCGILMDTPKGKRIILGFPVFFLDEATIAQMIRKAMIEFGEFVPPSYVFGDVNLDGSPDVSDVVSLVNYMFKDGSVPTIMSAADVNGSCDVDISDLVYFVNFIFKDGPDLLEGCVL